MTEQEKRIQELEQTVETLGNILNGMQYVNSDINVYAFGDGDDNDGFCINITGKKVNKHIILVCGSNRVEIDKGSISVISDGKNNSISNSENSFIISTDKDSNTTFKGATILGGSGNKIVNSSDCSIGN